MPELSPSHDKVLKLGNISYKLGLAILSAILFSAYSPQITSELPDTIRVFFENGVARFAVIVLIIYLGNNNLELSLLIAAAISLMMLLVQKYEIKESLANKIHEDFFIKDGSIEHFEDKGQTGFLNNLKNTLGQGFNQVGNDILGKINDEKNPTKTPHVTVYETPSPGEEEHSPPYATGYKTLSQGEDEEEEDEDEDEEYKTPHVTVYETPSTEEEHETIYSSQMNNTLLNNSQDTSNVTTSFQDIPVDNVHNNQDVQDHILTPSEPFVNYQGNNRQSHFNNIQHKIDTVIQQYKGNV